MANTQLKTRIILRNDTTAGWTAVAATVVLLKGEVGIEFDPSTNKAKVKIGNGESTWSNLEYFGGEQAQVWQVDCARNADKVLALNTHITASVKVHVGDIGIVKELINSASGGSIAEHRQYTSYVCITEGIGGASATCVWAAMDGNYDADNVFFNSDLPYTKQIGELPSVPSSGSGTIESTGKNVTTVLKTILAKDNTNPTITNPTAQITITGFPTGSTQEPGYTTSGTVSWSGLSLKDSGSYQYGPTVEGVTVDTAQTDAYKVVYNNGSSQTEYTASGSFDYEVNLGNSSITYSISETKVRYTAATNYAKSSLGNTTTKKISAGTTGNAETKSCTWTSSRKSFWSQDSTTGTVLHSTNPSVAEKTADSWLIRNLSSKEFGEKTSVTITADGNCKRIILAVPGNHNMTECIDVEGMGLDVAKNFTKYVNTIYVGGCDATQASIGSYPTTYSVFLWEDSAGIAAHQYKIKLS